MQWGFRRSPGFLSILWATHAERKRITNPKCYQIHLLRLVCIGRCIVIFERIGTLFEDTKNGSRTCASSLQQLFDGLRYSQLCVCFAILDHSFGRCSWIPTRTATVVTVCTQLTVSVDLLYQKGFRNKQQDVALGHE